AREARLRPAGEAGAPLRALVRLVPRQADGRRAGCRAGTDACPPPPCPSAPASPPVGDSRRSRAGREGGTRPACWRPRASHASTATYVNFPPDVVRRRRLATTCCVLAKGSDKLTRSRHGAPC